jgi:hypothetical protein
LIEVIIFALSAQRWSSAAYIFMFRLLFVFLRWKIYFLSSFRIKVQRINNIIILLILHVFKLYLQDTLFPCTRRSLAKNYWLVLKLMLRFKVFIFI